MPSEKGESLEVQESVVARVISLRVMAAFLDTEVYCLEVDKVSIVLHLT
jgi:hypothetical protein